ncbi:hypothetical protein C0991_006600 [Blastosporella zonata]|nr:hypothetical protein C0991_006600 [Blastosporella zonata]
MRAVYAPLGKHVIVEPLTFSESELDAQAFLSMMSVGSSEAAPLYIQIILTILRQLGENYTYQAFIRELECQKKKFNPAQLSGLEQRMSLLTSFIGKKKKSVHGGFKSHESRFVAGRLTIIDLSDPFIDPASACGLFEIIVRLFIRSDVGTGKVLVVDEAHKAIVLHRFSSPSWWDHLIKHVSADFMGSDAFDQVVKLHTGQAIVLAPSALGAFTFSTSPNKSLGRFGRRYLILKTRERVTQDGGASVLVIGT